MVNIEHSVFPCFSPFLFRHTKLFYAAGDVNSLLHCLSPRPQTQGPELPAADLKALAEFGWNMDKEMNSRREERVKLVIFLAHGCNYTRCIPEAFL